ncbi:MAG: coat family protein [Bacillales bacterium]|nr:coat family protein [Bacillales bacterium]
MANTVGKVKNPSVQEFKKFVKKHPKLITEVRKGSKSWQELYEDWTIIGEKDDYWNDYREVDSTLVNNETVSSEPTQNEVKKNPLTSLLSGENKTAMDWVGTIFTAMKQVDMNQVQNQISNVGTTLQSIQQVIQQFRTPTTDNKAKNPTRHEPPTFFQRD